uniref:Phosphoribulokinase/uridine kinase domain-containing protein n=1 Tax=Ditylenchus dipsaci TaxID=166011 RepID=A0A915DR25_9BILA
MDMKVFRKDVTGVLEQYLKFVKPAFDSFIAPGMKAADIIVPRDKNQLVERGYDASKNSQYRQELAQLHPDDRKLRPDTLHIVKETTQIQGIHTIIRNKKTTRDDFIFYAERLMCLLIEDALNFVPYEEVEVDTPSGQKYKGCKKCSNICGRLQNGQNTHPNKRAKYGARITLFETAKNISQYKVLLMDATVATGAAAMMAIRILLDHDVKEENIILLSLLMAETGVHRLAYAFPRLTLVTTAVDPTISEQYYVIPGLGNFGDRYFGSEAVGLATTDDEENLSWTIMMKMMKFMK